MYVSVDLRIAMFLSGASCNHSHITGLQLLLLLLLLLLLCHDSLDGFKGYASITKHFLFIVLLKFPTMWLALIFTAA
jgi:hypothetical protein